MDGLLESQQFQSDLRAACRGAFSRLGSRQSSYGNWEDLQQAVLIRFIKWLPRYRGDAQWRTVLTRIAYNLLIDAQRRELSQRRFHIEVDWDKVDPKSFTRKDNDLELRFLLDECLSKLSKQDRYIFIECRLKGRSTKSVAAELKVSPKTITGRLKRIIKEVEECFNS